MKKLINIKFLAMLSLAVAFVSCSEKLARPIEKQPPYEYIPGRSHTVIFMHHDDTLAVSASKTDGTLDRYPFIPYNNDSILLGWYDGKMEEVADSFDFANMKVTEDLVLRTGWKVGPPSVYFILNNGTDKKIKVTYAVGDMVKDECSEENAPESCVLENWYIDSNFQTPFDFSKPIEKTVKLYARWNLKDSEGNLYPIVPVFGRLWMAQDLKVTKYNDGTSILNGTDITVWTNKDYHWNGDEHPATAMYADLSSHNPEGEAEIIKGYHYNYAAVSDKLCPKGWNVPKDSEWQALLDAVLAEGKYTKADLAVPFKSTYGWKTNEQLAGQKGPGTDEFHLCVLPAMLLRDSGTIATDMVSYWAQELFPWNAKYALSRQFNGKKSTIYSDAAKKGYTARNCGIPVRCVKNL